MKLSFDTNTQENECILFRDLESWKSHANFLKNLTPRVEPAEEPVRYPCLALAAGYEVNSNGPDLEHYAFIYDFYSPET